MLRQGRTPVVRQTGTPSISESRSGREQEGGWSLLRLESELVSPSGERTHLTTKEWELLKLLSESCNEAVPRQEAADGAGIPQHRIRTPRPRVDPLPAAPEIGRNGRPAAEDLPCRRVRVHGAAHGAISLTGGTVSSGTLPRSGGTPRGRSLLPSGRASTAAPGSHGPVHP